MGFFGLFSKKSKTGSVGVSESPKASGKFVKRLKQATLSADYLNSDDLPNEAHQRLIHEIAEQCLNEAGLMKELISYCANHPLLGLELTDEILVLVKNDANKYRLGQRGLMFVPLYGRYSREVEALRGGRRRMTTTPTLRGGGSRGRG